MDDIQDKIKDIDNGRFSKLFDTIRIDDDCMRCFYFNPTITDPGLGIGVRPLQHVSLLLYPRMFSHIYCGNLE